MDRPTLSEQIELQRIIKSMTEQDCIDALTMKDRFVVIRLDMWLHSQANLFWRIIHWNWFCIYCGKTHLRIRDKHCKSYKDFTA